MPLTNKDLLGIESLTVEELELILDTAENFKEVSAASSLPAFNNAQA